MKTVISDAVTTFHFKSVAPTHPYSSFLLPEEERAMPFDLSLTKALDAGLEVERVGAQLVVWRHRAIFTAAACVLNHHRNRE